MKYFIPIILLGLFSCNLIEETSDPFDFFWTEMDKRYVYFEEKGIDWNAIYATCKPRTQTGNEKDLLRVLQEIIDILQDGHVSISTSDTTLWYDWYNKDEALIADLYRYALLPPETIDDTYTVVQLKNNILYIAFATFDLPVDYAKLQHTFSRYSWARGIIIDIRMNSGGYIRSVGEVAACFFAQQRVTYYERHKTGHGHNDFSDYIPITMTGYGLVPEKIPVVILTGSRTYSAANYFAAIMKPLPNVTLMGTRTGGGGSPSFSLIMPNGWRLNYPATPAYDIHRNSIEAGVAPHYTITTTAADVEEMQQTGIHRLMETAYQYLNNHE